MITDQATDSPAPSSRLTYAKSFATAIFLSDNFRLG